MVQVLGLWKEVRAAFVQGELKSAACVGGRRFHEPACVWNVKQNLVRELPCRSSGCTTAVQPSKWKMTYICLYRLCICCLISALEISCGPGKIAESVASCFTLPEMGSLPDRYDLLHRESDVSFWKYTPQAWQRKRAHPNTRQ